MTTPFPEKRDGINIPELLSMQKQLMESVPHDVRPDIWPKLTAARGIIEMLLLYLAACGHKPWRPNPLEKAERDWRFFQFQDAVNRLAIIHQNNPEWETDEALSRKVISAFGIIEESLEYINAVSQDDRPNQLEELTDILFFYLEQIAMSGFTLAEIEAEYKRKWVVNMKRYEDAEKGDFTWDQREKGEL